jgi:hypothetical protein
VIRFDEQGSWPGWLDVSFIRVRSDTGVVVVEEAGMRLERSLTVRFARPVVSVEIAAAGDGMPALQAVALHHPLRVARTGGPQLGPLRADLIDTLAVLGDDVWIEELRVVPLAEEMSDDWERVEDVALPAGPDDAGCRPGDTSRPFATPTGLLPATQASSIRDVLTGLFDERVRDAQGAVIPMGERLLDPAADGGLTVSLPTLTFLLLVAAAPGTARALRLLIDVDAADAAHESEWDYLLVGHWCPRRPLAGGERVELALEPPAPQWVAFAGPLLLTSPAPLAFAPGAVGQRGLLLGGEVVWVHLPQPAQAVELELGGGTVEVTAFAGERAVDWALALDRARTTVCAEEIDAVALYGVRAVVRALTYAMRDHALAGAPSAAVGDVGSWMLSARTRPRPAAPAGLVVEAVNDPTSVVATRSAGDRARVLAGISWRAAPRLDVLEWTAPTLPASYRVARGADADHLDTSVVGGDPPLVIAERPPEAAGESPAGPPSETPWYVLDPVEDGTVAVYGVWAVDVFGRGSEVAVAGPVTLADTIAPPPPSNVRTAMQASGALLVEWDWQGPDPDALGFRVYHKAGSLRRYTDGTVTAVAAAAGGTKDCQTSIAATAVPDLAALAGRVVRVGGDDYLVKSCAAVTVAGGVRLRLTLRPNASTPARGPAVGDPIRVYAPPPQPGELNHADAYDGFEEVADPAARSRTLQLSWPAADEHGRATVAVGVSCYDANAESAVAGPSVAARIETAVPAPPKPTTADESDVFSSRADARGQARHRFTTVATAGVAYHVYRALDETLLRVDAGQRTAAGTRGGAPADPAPLTQQDFVSVTGAPPGPAASLSNRRLHALANLAGNEAAFEQLTREPIVASSGTLEYLDGTLPGGSRNRYLYRLRSVAASGAFGDFGRASPPVRLWPEPPTRPTIAHAAARGSVVELRWNPSPESEVDRYRIHVATEERRAADERTMTLVAEVDRQLAGEGGEPILGVAMRASPGTRYWFRVVAVATYPAPVGSLRSAPSEAVTVVSSARVAPQPPAPGGITVTKATAADEVTVSFAAEGDPTSRYMLLRRPPGPQARPLAVCPWTPPQDAEPTVVLLGAAGTTAPPASPVVLTDGVAPASGTSVVYVIGCTNETGQVVYSDPVSFQAP